MPLVPSHAPHFSAFTSGPSVASFPPLVHSTFRHDGAAFDSEQIATAPTVYAVTLVLYYTDTSLSCCYALFRQTLSKRFSAG